MINTILTKVFGSQHEREVKKLLPSVAAISEMEPQIQALSDAELRAKTLEFKSQIEAGATTEDLLVPAFAVAREAAWRAVHMRPFDVQLMGGMVLHRGPGAPRRARSRPSRGATAGHLPRPRARRAPHRRRLSARPVPQLLSRRFLSV